MDNGNEIHLSIFGFKIYKFGFGIGLFKTEGTPTRVEFVAETTLKYKKFLIGFYHVHPNMLNVPSSVDKSTMYCWCDTLGKPLHCFIEGIDAEYSSMIAGDVWHGISNYVFITDPMGDTPNYQNYFGHVHRFGRLFVWKDL